jgi:predicted DNA-binding transcriptional regulator YafY
VTAISEQRLCTVVYRAAGATKGRRFRILPLRLFVHDRAIYMHALVPRYGDVVVLNLQRLESLEVKSEKGTAPADYDPSQWEGATFGVFSGGPPVEYHLRFSAVAAPYIRERCWHPTQKIRNLKGGGVSLTFTCRESPEVASWVASWRREVLVVAPATLRSELAEVGSWLQKSYGGASP